MRSSKSLVSGYYGMGNFGDDLFVATLARASDDLLFCSPPVRGVSAKFLVPSSFGGAFRAQGIVGAAIRLVFGLLGHVLAGRHILGGGSILQDLRGVRRLQLTLDRVLPTRWVLLGVSVGPFKSDIDRQSVSRFLERAERIDVRDEASLLELQTMGLAENSRNLGDLVGAYPVATGAEKAGRALFIPCSHISFEQNLRFARFLARAVGGSDLQSLCILSLNSNEMSGDDVIAGLIAACLQRDGVVVEIETYLELGIEPTVALIASSNCVVSARLHGGLVAFLAGVPTLMIEYHRKVTDFLMDVDLTCAGITPDLDDERLEKELTGLIRQKPSLGDVSFYRTRSMRYLEI